MVKRDRRRDAAQWEKIVQEQQTSGRSQAAFCKSRGLALSTFQRWRGLLRSGAVGGNVRSRSGDSAAQPLFAELLVSEAGANGTGPEAAWDVELELGGGVRLRMRRAG